MTPFLCSYLGGEVEWSAEREAHIAANQPDLIPEHRDLIAKTRAEADEVRPSQRLTPPMPKRSGRSLERG